MIPIVSPINAANGSLAYDVKDILTQAYNKNNTHYTGDSLVFSNRGRLWTGILPMSVTILITYENQKVIY